MYIIHASTRACTIHPKVMTAHAKLGDMEGAEAWLLAHRVPAWRVLQGAYGGLLGFREVRMGRTRISCRFHMRV